MTKTIEKDANLIMDDTFDESTSDMDMIYVPTIDNAFVSWGVFDDLTSIIKSREFMPVYISGESGNGKTMFVEQSCAVQNRRLCRVQINPETDENDLIGGYTLVNGNTIYKKGPVIRAMEEGTILMLDEIDRGTNKLMCMQGILEGKPYLMKKTGEIIKPKKGFKIIATANTKGLGEKMSQYVAASVLDEAFLERFPVSFEQPYPAKIIEEKIIKVFGEANGVELSPNMVKNVVKWARDSRESYTSGGIDNFISTRRVCQVIKTYGIFGDFEKSIKYSTNRFDDMTSEALVDLYRLIQSKEESDTKAGDSPSGPAW